jgi:hypothetical protein
MLMRLCTKGISGDFIRLRDWHAELQSEIPLLAQLMVKEIETDYQKKEIEKKKTAEINFTKLMVSLSCGSYSPCKQVVEDTFQTLKLLVQNL